MDPYSTEQHQGSTKPNTRLERDSEGGTFVVGPSTFAGGVEVPKGVNPTIIGRHSVEGAGGVAVAPIDFDPARPGAMPTRLGYNPHDPKARGAVPVAVNPNDEGGCRAVAPWYSMKAKIASKGVGEENYAYVCKVIQLHGQLGSFLPPPMAQLLQHLAHFGDQHAGAAFAYSQEVERQVRAQMRQRGMV